jgi:glycine dehydrogenase subunit 1
MEVSNASLSTATTSVETVNMAYANFAANTQVVISPSHIPICRDCTNTPKNLSAWPAWKKILSPGRWLIGLVDNNTALVIVQYPDFFGRLFDLHKIAEATHQAGALLCVNVNPIALGLFTRQAGADIVTGEPTAGHPCVWRPLPGYLCYEDGIYCQNGTAWRQTVDARDSAVTC